MIGCHRTSMRQAKRRAKSRWVDGERTAQWVRDASDCPGCSSASRRALSAGAPTPWGTLMGSRSPGHCQQLPGLVWCQPGETGAGVPVVVSHIGGRALGQSEEGCVGVELDLSEHQALQVAVEHID